MIERRCDLHDTSDFQKWVHASSVSVSKLISATSAVVDCASQVQSRGRSENAKSTRASAGRNSASSFRALLRWTPWNTPSAAVGAGVEANVLSEFSVPAASVAQVALAHGLNANLVHGGAGKVSRRRPQRHRTGHYDVHRVTCIAPVVDDIRIELRSHSSAVNEVDQRGLVQNFHWRDSFIASRIPSLTSTRSSKPRSFI
jgi:hypothetical protein